MTKNTFQILKGTRDFLPTQFISRKNVIKIIEETFELFGFEPMETPALEYAETVEEKYGEEGEKLMYTFSDRGGRNVALRYDLTVPLARAMAMYQVDKPFRRYQISPVWRADKPQKGRFREFWQCDVDIVGSEAMWADAEVIAVCYFVLKKLGFDNFTIRINNRKLLNGIALYGGIASKNMAEFFRSIDKVDKIGWDGVRNELQLKGYSASSLEKAFDVLAPDKKKKDTLPYLRALLKDIPIACEGVDELAEINRCLIAQGVEQASLEFDVSLARGLDYYTGPIFETVVKKPRIGSITGGGRYDRLIGMFGSEEVPATGSSLGLERIITSMEELSMLPVTATLSKVLVTVFDSSSVDASMEVVSELRSAAINSEVSVRGEKLKKQLAYANKKGVPLVVIIGPDEKEQGLATIKDMRSNNQITVSRGELVQTVRELLAGAGQ